MSRNAQVTVPFGDGVHIFRLGIGQLEELQEKTDCGPEEIYHRVSAGSWRVQDLTETIRLGLIGGGMQPLDALMLTRRYADSGALAGHKSLVLAIIGAALLGAPDEDDKSNDDTSGEPEAGAKDPSPAEKSGSGRSTKPEHKSAGPSATSGTPASGS